jgi:hypothetical protein
MNRWVVVALVVVAVVSTPSPRVAAAQGDVLPFKATESTLVLRQKSVGSNIRGRRTQSSKYVGSRLAFVFVINLGLFDFSF